MNRTIVSVSDLLQTKSKRLVAFGDPVVALGGPDVVPNGVPATSDGYLGRLLKYVPPDVIGAFIFVEAAVRASPESSAKMILAWSIFGFMLCATPFYLLRIGGVTKVAQIAISTAAFAVWAFAYYGTPFSYLNLQPAWTAVVLGLFTFLVPFFDPGPVREVAGSVTKVTS